VLVCAARFALYPARGHASPSPHAAPPGLASRFRILNRLYAAAKVKTHPTLCIPRCRTFRSSAIVFSHPKLSSPGLTCLRVLFGSCSMMPSGLADLANSTRSATDRSEPSGRPLAVDEPWHAKLVYENTETKRPKCFLQRHLNRSVFCQGIEDAVGLHWITEIEL
jgi:hypothetical protein